MIDYTDPESRRLYDVFATVADTLVVNRSDSSFRASSETIEHARLAAGLAVHTETHVIPSIQEPEAV